jgi:hypothetical protein
MHVSLICNVIYLLHTTLLRFTFCNVIYLLHTTLLRSTLCNVIYLIHTTLLSIAWKPLSQELLNGVNGN